MSKPDVGVIGLAVMGSNLARNIESRGIPVAVYNRSRGVTEQFEKDFVVDGSAFVSSYDLEGFVNSMQAPRQIFIMIKAGGAVDAIIDQLIPLLDKGDIIIDGGNTYFKDTIRREKKLHDVGLNFLGVGISGGEEGALKGPSLMPGGPKEAWKIVQPLLEKIAAVADEPCTNYVGPNGAGHFVKMVHNGIEYGDMQLIAEAYDILKRIGGYSPTELQEIFASWNKGPLSSYLIEITAKIFGKRDEDDSSFLVDKILDKAGQKGTGTWTAQIALELGVAIPTISAAVDARILSSMKDQRVDGAKEFMAPEDIDSAAARSDELVSQVHDALYASKIMSYAQGMALIASASDHWQWDLKLDEIAAMWKGGCIIRAQFLDEIRRAFKGQPDLKNLVTDPFMKQELTRCIPSLRHVVCRAAERGIPTLALSGSLSYFDSFRTVDLPQNLTQAQRDFFGAHTYERKDKDGVFHTEWSE